ncbi:MAG TPA: polymorphic toxin-type HINT domain-containing protein [Candidatus Bathyarchaeia archaeon]|nr:polymorphic toxin-type HINT domain-containing protein [Candidatus Bathyarchaeia archaeon]
MEFYDGPITGEYNEDFLLSVISFEVVLNRSVHVGLNTTIHNTQSPLGEKGEITPQLLNYVRASKSVGRDKYGKFAEFLFSGDVVIYQTTATLVPAFRVSKIAGKLIKKAVKTLDEAYDCDCFTAGTKVLTKNGPKQIEHIKVGDMVLSKTDITGEIAYKEVEWLFNREVEETYQINVGTEIITTTAEHPFWIHGKDVWIETKNLKSGDVLTTSDGKIATIDKIEIVRGTATVYNFKVKDFHSYFVTSLGIWTHNSCENSPYIDLFRAIEQPELDDLKQNNYKFRIVPTGFQVKQFGVNYEEVRRLSKSAVFKNTIAIVRARIPKTMYNQLDHTPVDPFYLKSGSVSVHPDMIDKFNESLIEVEIKYFD